LRTPAAKVVDFDKELRVLLKDLWDTLADAEGAGLAAPQLGVGLRVFVYNCDGLDGYLVNPTWNVIGDGYHIDPEGCLSIPGMRWDCRRHEHVVATGWNAHGEPMTVDGTKLLARCIQHEVDHLDGVLFLDRLDPETRRQAMKEIRASEWFDGAAPVIKQNPHPMFGGR